MVPANIDFETRSTVDIKKTGAYPYAMDATTDVWVLAIAFGDEEPEIWCPWWEQDAKQRQLKERICEHVFDNGELHAWNAQFERLIWKYVLNPRHGFVNPEPDQIFCTMVKAAAYGLPLALGFAAEVLGLDEQKDKDGGQLMMRMAKPRRVEPDGTIVWWNDAERLSRLAEYCRQDVRTERAIGKMLKPLKDSERQLYLLDQRINNRGVLLDRPLAEAALKVAEIAMEDANRQIDIVTAGRVKSINQVIELASWVKEQGVECNGVAKGEIERILADELTPVKVREALTLRQEAGKSSVAKVEAMLEYASGPDDRMRGMLQFLGASGTGRWSGRGFQPQNIARGTIPEIEKLLPLILAHDVEGMRMLASPMEILSSALRSMLHAGPNRKLMVADFSAIEARVLAWLAGQDDLLRLFREKKDVYKHMAAKIYGVAPEDVSKQQRFVGKSCVLGLGYQMGPSKFVAACKMLAGVDISEDFSKEVVSTYRNANQKIVALWKNLNDHALMAVKRLPPPNEEIPVRYYREDDWLFCELPSGRTLKYAKPRIVPREMPWTTEDGRPVVKDVVQVQGFNNVIRKWERQYLYGGLLAENITQACARDLMAEAMERVENAGYSVTMTVHDEIVSEAPVEFGSDEEFEHLMCVVPDWAAGCPIAAEAWSGPRYKK